MSGVGIGHGIGLDPDMLAGQSGGAPVGGGGPVIFGMWQLTTAQTLPANNWSAAIAWDDSAKNLDTEGILETSTYKTFTIPTDCILEIFVNGAPNTGSTGDAESLMQAVTPGTTDQIAIPAQESKNARLFNLVHKQLSGHSSDTHWVGFCASGTQFQIRIYTAGPGAASKTDAHTYLQMTIWPV